jgi:uncharacterized protein (UPF0276 family)
MIQLTANLSDALLDLFQSDGAHVSAALVDAVEVGPWFSLAQIHRFQSQLPGWQFYFHAGNAVMALGTARRLKAYLRATAGPWTSCHLSLLRPGYIWLALRWGWYLPSPNVPRAVDRFVRRVAALARAVDLPILLENMPAPPDEKGRYAFDADPDIINEILARTGCHLLLDLAHARVAAAGQGLDVHDYLALLPLDKVLQIHVSGPGMRDGHLRDLHEPLQEVDYALLDWVLARTRPQVVTLEYFKERQPLHEQLTRLRGMLES